MAGNMLDLDELIGSVQELLTALVKVKATIASNSSNPSNPSTSKHGSSLRKTFQPQEEVKTSIPQVLEYIHSEVVRLRTKLNLEAPKQAVEKNTSHDKFQKPSNDNSIDLDDQKTPEAILTGNVDQNHPDRDIEIQNGKEAAIPTSNVDEKHTDRGVEIPTSNAEKTLDGGVDIATGNAEKTLDGDVEIPTGNAEEKTLDGGAEITTGNAEEKTLDGDVEIPTGNAEEKTLDGGAEILTGNADEKTLDGDVEIPTGNAEKALDGDVEIPTGNAEEKTLDGGAEILTGNADEKTLDGDVEIPTGNAEEKTLDGGAEIPTGNADEVVGIPTSNLDAKTLERGIEFPTSSANKHPNTIQPLHQKDINTLNDGRWLNDEVINAYICFLKAKSKINVYFASTYFFSKLVPGNSSRIDFKAVNRWTKSVNLFEQKYAVYPIHQAGNHWSLAIITNLSSLLASISPLSPTIITIDSLDQIGNLINQSIFDRLQEYVIEEAKAKLGSDIKSEVVLWNHAKHLPIQSNSFDCGVFILLLLEQFLQDPDAFMSDHSVTIDSLQGRHHIRSTLLRAIPQQDINMQLNNDKKSSSDETHVLTSSTSSTSGLTTVFKFKDMGTSMVSTIEDFVACNTEKVYKRGYFKAQIQSLPEIDWEHISKNTTQPGKDQLRAFAFSDCCGGVARASAAEPSRRKFVFPKVWEVPKNPPHSEAEIENSFQRMIDQPPQGSLSYYIGPPLLPTYTPTVDAGERLKRRGSGSLPGINQIYWYLSSVGGTPAPMHIEDACLGSVNLVLAGHEKHWLFIPPSQRKKLEQHIQICSKKLSYCSQSVRHEDLLLSPKLLREWGIDFYLEFCAAGEMIITLPETYHQVQNDGPNVAESVNFEFSTTPDMPIAYNWCKKDSCGQHVLTETDFMLSGGSIVTDIVPFQALAPSQTLQKTMLVPAKIEPSGLTDHSGLLADLHEFAQASGWDETDLSTALADETLKAEERARIIQMIVQCSTVSFITPKENLLKQTHEHLSEFVESVLEILASFREIEQRSTICSFEKSLYLIQLAQMFRQGEAVIAEQMKQKRNIRRRQKGLPYKRETARTKAMDSVLAQLGDQNTPQDRRKLSRLIDEGETLHTIKEACGIDMIALLSESGAQENHLTFPRGEACFKTLAKPIQPSDYNQLAGKGLEYFITWVPIFCPGVDRHKDCRAAALGSSEWKKEMQPLSEGVRLKRKSPGDISQLPKRTKMDGRGKSGTRTSE